MKSLHARFLLILLGLIGSVWLSFAADISHTPLISGTLLGSDRVPVGRPSDGHVDGRGTAATASLDQIKTFVQEVVALLFRIKEKDIQILVNKNEVIV